MKPLIAIIFIMFSGICYAGTREPSVPDSKYVEYGKKFTYVYKICGTYKDGKLFCASAVVINPNWILTAAHVVDNARICVVSENDNANLVDEIIVHKDFNPDKFGFGDIALGYMKKPIELDFYPPLYTEKDEKDKLCCISGYGFTGTFKTGYTFGDDKKRAGSNKIEYIENELLICTASTKTSRNATGLEFLIASGDSGGGLFIDGKLAGINSSVLAVDRKADSSYGDESAHSRISSYLEWIKETMKSKGKED